MIFKVKKWIISPNNNSKEIRKWNQSKCETSKRNRINKFNFSNKNNRFQKNKNKIQNRNYPK